MKQFMAPYASQLTDGRLTDDTYYHTSARQVPMGNETGTFAYADFCYDRDELYMTCLVYRRDARSEEPFPDGINFYVESKGASTDIPLGTAYRFNILPDATLSICKGNGKDWVQTELPTVNAASTVASANYRIELAIPWSAIGLSAAPVGSNLSVNLEILTGDGTQQLVECIPDALPTKPATWMPLKLIEADETGINEIKNENLIINNDVYDLQGRKVEHPQKGIYIIVDKAAGSKKVLLNS